MSAPRPGDFSAVWPLLSDRARGCAQELIRLLAVTETERLRVELHQVVRQAPRLHREDRENLIALLALLEDRT